MRSSEFVTKVEGAGQDAESYTKAVISEYRDSLVVTLARMRRLRGPVRGADPLKSMCNRALKYVRQGVPGKALRLLEEVKRCEDENCRPTKRLSSTEAKEYVELKGLYPQRVEALDDIVLAPNFSFSDDDLVTVLRSPSRETSSGVSGWTNELVRTLGDPAYNELSERSFRSSRHDLIGMA